MHVPSNAHSIYTSKVTRTRVFTCFRGSAIALAITYYLVLAQLLAYIWGSGVYVETWDGTFMYVLSDVVIVREQMYVIYGIRISHYTPS